MPTTTTRPAGAQGYFPPGYQFGAPYGSGVAAPQAQAAQAPLDRTPMQGLSAEQMQLFAQQAAGGGGTYTGANTVAAPAPQFDAGDWYRGVAANAANTPQGPSPEQQNYIAAFNSSIAQQRSAIDQALWQAMGALGQRRDAAAGASAKLPDQVKAIYADVQGKVNQGNKTATAAAPTAVGGDVNDKLIASALGQNQGAGLAAVPLVNAAIEANYTSGQTALNQQHLAGINDLAQQQAQFQMRAAEMNASRAAQVEDRKAEREWQAKQADEEYQRKLDYYDYTKGTSGNDPLAQARAQALDEQALNNGFEGGYAQQHATEQSPDFKYAMSVLNGTSGKGSSGAANGMHDPNRGDRELPTALTDANNDKNVQKAWESLTEYYKTQPYVLKALFAYRRQMATSAQFAPAR
jgi:hypothetical protein